MESLHIRLCDIWNISYENIRTYMESAYQIIRIFVNNKQTSCRVEVRIWLHVQIYTWWQLVKNFYNKLSHRVGGGGSRVIITKWGFWMYFVQSFQNTFCIVYESACFTFATNIHFFKKRSLAEVILVILCFKKSSPFTHQKWKWMPT